MKKGEILKLYINDLQAHVIRTEARDNRIAFLHEELERTESDNSEYMTELEAIISEGVKKEYSITEIVLAVQRLNERS